MHPVYGTLCKSAKKEKLNMNKQHLETVKQLEIKKAPEKQSIEAANDNYTKKQLAHFIERHDLDIAKSWKKAEIVEALTEWMESTQKDVLESDSDLQSFYSDEVVNADESLNIYDEELSDDKLESILKLAEHGLAYNVDGQLWTPETKVAEVSTEENETTEETKIETSKEEAVLNSQSKPTTQSTFPSAFKEEDIEKKKEARLKYLKKQAKRKKKGKKRK